MAAASDSGSKYTTAPMEIPENLDAGHGKANGPVQLTPPPSIGPLDGRTTGAEISAGQRRWSWLSAGALLVAAIAMVAVFVGLPRWVDRGASPAPAPVEAARPTHSGEPEVTSGMDRSISASAEAVHRHMQSLEQRLVIEWGGATWSEVRRLAAAAETYRSAGDVAAAATVYTDLGNHLTALEAEAEAVVSRTLDDGRKALADGDTVAARRAFQHVAEVQPGNPEAAAGLAHAEISDRVFDLLAAAEEYERSGDHQRAVDAARQAAAIDASSTRAREMVARSSARLAEEKYSAAVSAGLAALEDERYEDAHRDFTQAASLRPGAPEIGDGLVRAEAGRRRLIISELRQHAAELVQAEAWAEAAAVYGEVLDVDGTMTFASTGRAECLDRSRLADRIDAYISRPDRLATDEVLEAASQLLEEARAITPRGPLHRQQVARLAGVVDAASTKIEVVLESDGKTEVLIHRIGNLGTFDRRRLELRPGTYVIVGSRDGYRDLRVSLEVAPHPQPQPVSVRCTEELSP